VTLVRLANNSPPEQQMRVANRLFGLVAATALIAGAAHAQGAPKLEFGLDAVLAHIKTDGASGGFGLVTPLDVRIGFVRQGLMFETRFRLQAQLQDGDHFYALAPSLNAILPIGARSGLHNQMGPYVTGGLGLDLLGSSGGDSDSRLSLNVGLGTRIQAGAVALRPEAFVLIANEGDVLPGSTMFGVRFGLSFWK
jgi:hypothetical protein